MIAKLRTSLARAVAAAEHAREHRGTCPACGKRRALLTLSFEGMRIGALCRFCGGDTLGTLGRKKAR